MVVLVGNSGGSYIRLPRALNAAIVLWKMKASLDAFQFRTRCLSWLDPEHNRVRPAPPQAASPLFPLHSCHFPPLLFPSLFTTALPLNLCFGKENM